MATPRVLVAHPDDDCRHIYKKVLELDGMAVQEVASVEDAFAALERSGADVIVSDLYLESRGDVCLLRRLRADPRYARVPVLIVTGWSSESHQALGLREGADDVLVMPVSAREVARRVRAIFNRAELGRVVPLGDRNAESSEHPAVT